MLGACHQPELPRGAAIATFSELSSWSRLRPGCRNCAATGHGFDLRVWLLIHLEAGVARLRLAFCPHRHLVRRCYGYRREERILASVGLVLRVASRVKRSGLGPGCFHQCCYAQRHRPHGQTGQDAVAILLDGGNRAGCFRSGRYRVRASPGRSRNGATPKAARTPYVRKGRHRSGPQLVKSTLHRRGYGTMHSCSVCVRMLSIGNSMYRRQEARYPRNEFPDAAWEH